MYLIGIDVGTGSARAGVFDARGTLLGTAAQEIALWKGPGNRVEQSSDEIWQAVCAAVRGAVAQAGVSARDIKGLGFDATCSLVLLGAGGVPLPLEDGRNIIVWMDHRATEQAERINAIGHPVLDYVGGHISPEMQTPKLLWLKENVPHHYTAVRQFMDLTDFLTWRATGDCARSICTVTCKWTYLAHEARWDAGYFERIGLGELCDDDFDRIGARVVPAGTALGAGLTAQAAADLGLVEGTPVGAGLIDAHAGGLGTVGTAGDPAQDMAYVFGTSSCTMTTTRDPAFVPGVWGPYQSAMVPGMWLNEGGQSAAGAAVDQLIDHHPFATEARALAQAEGKSLPAWLADRLGDLPSLVRGLHVLPEVLGNRAPHADPHRRAVIVGLGMGRDLESLKALYGATLCGLGYGLRQIIEAQAREGATVARIAISGGAGRHPVVRQILADTTGLPVVAPKTAEPVLLGSAMLGALAAGVYADATQAMAAMSRAGDVTQPDADRGWHGPRFALFEEMQRLATRAVQA
ncbi:FGGY-family carbohydrate kinase [Sagittula salina]|uniref:FGGY-family carbohydrate kinase n=1 Tax=Sagittula salina TaxID=2820268 RepID=A0A940MQB4_9RHOB|nr:FGGY-family carbohydrate kinase [Sagittula salina]MBP0482157.1 FGGY-family carbohydrate kinase [Sagittula salina]